MGGERDPQMCRVVTDEQFGTNVGKCLAVGLRLVPYVGDPEPPKDPAQLGRVLALGVVDWALPIDAGSEDGDALLLCG